ncbi:MAG: 4-hydroxythreonine-4-phosphate dehydrogenase PdxA [Gaiellales bacterium]
MTQRPVVAVTMGDPAGVGPEVCVKALADEAVRNACRPLVVGDGPRLELAARVCGLVTAIRAVDAPAAARFETNVIDAIDLALVPSDLPFGEVSPAAGEAAYRFVERAVELALAREVSAICTAPLNKAALHAAGHAFPGHTELLAHLTGTPEVSMMLVTEQLRVIHVTTHLGLVDAIARIEPGLVERTIRRGVEALRAAGIASPRVGVCGINPHAGEGGLFGHGEEQAKIEPALAAVRATGIEAEGPLPADTAFYRAQRGDFDLVVAMYHDQGHAPVKVLGLEHGVNVTVGLPIVRTSVDHGTAFDIAGTGVVDERSMVAALLTAAALTPA